MTKEEMRVPGLGVGSVERILQARRHTRVRAYDLRGLRVPARARFFVMADGDTAPLQHLDSERLIQKVRAPKQLELFAAARSARDGEL